jgi:signal transduction histidine kinase
MSVRNPRIAVRGLSLAWRLLLPLIVVVALSWAAVTLFLVNVVSDQMDAASRGRLESLADALVAGGMALDETLLNRVRAVTGSDVIALSSEGNILATTLPEHAAGYVVGVHGDRPDAGSFLLGEERFLLVSKRPARVHNGAYSLLVTASTRRTDRLKAGLAWMIAGSAGVGLLMVIVVGQYVIRSATRPLVSLAEAARELGKGSLDRPVPEEGSAETKVLAREFNLMTRELADSRTELVRAERLATAGKMAAGVAHEIRNPLSSLRLQVQLLAGGHDGDEELRRRLSEILEEVDRLDQVLANFLAIASPANLEPRPENLNAVIESTLRLTSRKLEHLDVSVIREFEENLPDIPLDSQRIRQAVLNLILNAADSMAGGGTLRVSTGQSNGIVSATLEDTGSGIRPEVAERVFEPFFTTKSTGVGLGLYLARQILESHGGRIDLEPGPDGGSRFVLSLPVADAGGTA